MSNIIISNPIQNALPVSLANKIHEPPSNRYYRNLSLVALTIIGAIVLISAVGLHSWMIYPAAGLAFLFCANNIRFHYCQEAFAKRIIAKAVEPVEPPEQLPSEVSPEDLAERVIGKTVFPYSSQLCQFVRDPDLNEMELGTFKKRYPLLSEKVSDFQVFKERVMKEGSFLVFEDELGFEIAKGASLIQYAFENADSQDWKQLEYNLELQALQISLSSKKSDVNKYIRKAVPDEHSFECAIQLYQLMRDPGLSSMSPEDLAQKYSALSQQVPNWGALITVLRTEKQSSFPVSLYPSGLDRQIIKGALLFDVERRNSRDISRFSNAFDVLQALCSQFSEAEIEMILNPETVLDHCHKLLVGSLILLDMSEFLEIFKKFGFSVLTEEQETFFNKIKLPADFSRKVNRAVCRCVHHYFGIKRQLDHARADRNRAYNAQKPTENGIIIQFAKDAHRLGKVRMVDGDQILELGTFKEKIRLSDLSEEEHRKSTFEAIAATLKRWATSPEGVFDENLYVNLQHLICQESEKPASELAFISEIGPLLAQKVLPTKAGRSWLSHRIGGIAPLKWTRTLVHIERMKDGAEFRSSPEFTLSFDLVKTLHEIDLPSYRIGIKQVMKNKKITHFQRIPLSENDLNAGVLSDGLSLIVGLPEDDGVDHR